MRNHIKTLGSLFLAAALLTTMPAMAGEKSSPEGTVAIDETQFSLIVGGSAGGGKLVYRGGEHDFKLSGLSVGANVGAAKVSAVGEVYHLTDLANFPGTYTKFDASATLGGGVGALYLKNEKGVVMKLTSRNQGLQLNVGSATGVKVVMAKQ
jgi:hypothetical protein